MIPKLTFGRTGHQSTRTLFGAAALGGVTQAETDQTMEVLMKYGVNHIDTAASYGESELRLGPWIEKHRQEFFLASKTGDRDYTTARVSIRRSLERLRTDHLDLIQLHAVIEDDELEESVGDEWGAEGGHRGEEGRPGALHWHHQPHAACPGDLPASTEALRFRTRCSCRATICSCRTRSTAPISRRWKRCAAKRTWRCR